MIPQKLPKQLWKLFSKFHFARTPHQQRIQLFNRSRVIGPCIDSFNDTINRILHAFLQMDPRLKTVTLCFVEGGRTHIDLIYEPESQTLRIHEKWTSFDRTHEQSSCEIKTFSDLASTYENEFLCDHVAEDLVGRVLDEVRDPLKLTPTEYEDFRQKARSCIYAMPRNITAKATANANELEVCWIGNESGIVCQRYGVNMRYLVTLHKSSTCEANKSQLLDETGMRLCCVDAGITDTDIIL